jgi:flagellar biosynthesis protein FliR
MLYDWSQYLQAGMLVLIRLSGLMVFAPLFSSAAIPARVKAGFTAAITLLLTPAVSAVPNAHVSLDAQAILGELGVGLLFGLSLMLLSESIAFAGTLLSIEFSFSLVNLMDPNSMVETPVMGQLLGWLNLLVLIGAGLDRSLLAALIRSFFAVPVGHAVVQGKSVAALAAMAGGIFLAGLQLATPVIAAALVVEVTVGLVSRISPQLPAMVVGVPLKTLMSYAVLMASLAVWPGWIERHFTALLDAAQRLVAGA